MSLNKINKYREIGIEAILLDKDLTAEFAYFYFQLTVEKICVGCSGKMRQKFTDLMNTNNQKLKTMSEQKFIMEPGKLIDRTMSAKGLSGQYNADKMTDEIALQLLKSEKGYIKFFKKVPENWEELVKAAKFPEAPKAKKVPAEISTDDTTEETTDVTDATDDRADAIEAINSTEGKSSTDMNAKEVIALVERMDGDISIMQFTVGEYELKKKRKTVIKAIKKRLRQLSE